MRLSFFFFIVFLTTKVSLAFETSTSFYWQLQGSIKNLPQNYDVYGLDLDEIEANPKLVLDLHKAGKRIICYFSAGTFELDRKPNRYNRYYNGPKGKRMPGWNELWLDIRRNDVRQAHSAILQDAYKAGCDGVDPDNVDHSLHGDIGFSSRISREENIEYLQWLAKEAHQQGLKVGLKNSGEFVSFGNLADHFDFSLNEQCFTYKECRDLLSFSQKNKAVYIVEYEKTHESKAYPMKSFKRDCDFSKKNGLFFFVYKTQLLDGRVAKTCWL